MKAPHTILLPLLLIAILLAGCGGELPALTKLPPGAVILAFGDSLTHGSGARTEEAYPAVLAELTGLTVVNRGIPGEVTAKGLARLPVVLDEVRPQLMILCHGGNDMLRKKGTAQAAENIRRMVRLAREHGAQVMLIGVPAPGLLLGTAEFYEPLAEELAAPIEAEALADILSERDFKSDTIHPNAAGYRRLAEAVRDKLREVGAL